MERDLPAARDAVVNVAGVILGELWDAENSLTEIGTAFRELLSGIEASERRYTEQLRQFGDRAETLQRHITAFRQHIGNVRDLMESLPLKRPDTTRAN